MPGEDVSPDRAPTWRGGGPQLRVRQSPSGTLKPTAHQRGGEAALFRSDLFPARLFLPSGVPRMDTPLVEKSPQREGVHEFQATAEVDRRALRLQMLLGVERNRAGLCKEWTQLPSGMFFLL